MTLPAELLGLAGSPGVRLRIGEVTATGPLEVALGGGDPYPDVKALASASLTVGDIVAVLQTDGDLLVLGEIA